MVYRDYIGTYETTIDPLKKNTKNYLKKGLGPRYYTKYLYNDMNVLPEKKII